MNVLPSLCAALERVGGDRLVLREGERPHVLMGLERHDVARALLTRGALEGLAREMLSDVGRHALGEGGTVVETIHAPGIGALTAEAKRVNDALYIELRRDAPDTPSPVAEPEQRQRDNGVAVMEGEDAPAVEDIGDSLGTEVTKTPLSLVASLPVAPPDPVPAHSRHDIAFAARLARQAQDTATTSRDDRPPSDGGEASADLSGLIAGAAAKGATALYLRAGHPAAARINERITPLGSEAIAPALFERLDATFENGGGWQTGSDVGWVRHDEDLGEITCQSFTDHLGPGLVIRFRPRQTLRQFHRQIPRHVRSACDGDGLVVVSAATETEMLEMAAAVADFTGQRRGGYLITLAPAGSRQYDITGAFVSQRELGPDPDHAFAQDAASPAAAIRRATSELPDVLLVVPPAQSAAAMREALKAATGSRLVVIGVVAPTTVAALRLLSSGDTAQATMESRLVLAKTFRAGFTHRTVRRLGGGLIQVQDLVTGTSEVSALLAKGDFTGLARLQSVGADRMRTIDQALARTIARRHLTLRQASAYATDRQQLVELVRAARREQSTEHPGRASSRRPADVSYAPHNEEALLARADAS